MQTLNVKKKNRKHNNIYFIIFFRLKDTLESINISIYISNIYQYILEIL